MEINKLIFQSDVTNINPINFASEHQTSTHFSIKNRPIKQLVLTTNPKHHRQPSSMSQGRIVEFATNKYIIYADTSKRLSHFDSPKCLIYYRRGGGCSRLRHFRPLTRLGSNLRPRGDSGDRISVLIFFREEKIGS